MRLQLLATLTLFLACVPVICSYPKLFRARPLPVELDNDDVFHKSQLFQVPGGTIKIDGTETKDEKKYIPPNVFFGKYFKTIN